MLPLDSRRVRPPGRALFACSTSNDRGVYSPHMHIQTMARWTTLIALFLIPFIPLYIASDMYFPFITGKGFAFRILVEVALAGYVLLALVDARYRPKFSWTYLLYGALVLWMVLANFLAENVHKAFGSNFERMDGFVTIVHMFVFFAVLGSVLTVDQLWRKWWLTFLAAAGLVCAYGLFQLAGMAEIHQGGARVDATFGNAAYLGVYLLFVIAIALWQAFESKGWLRNILFAFVFVSAAILFATATRGAIIGLAGATLLGSVLWAFESKKKSRILAGGVFLGLLVLIGVFFMAKDTTFIKSDPTLARLSSISLKDGTTRFGIWNIAFAGAQERPVFGWGQEGFTYVFQKYYHPSLFGQEPWFDRAHNTYLDWLIAGGIPALLLFLGLLGSAVVALYRKSVSRPERIMLVCALAAYGFQALFVFDNLFSYLGLAALLAAAHAASGVPIKKLAALPEVNRREASTVAATVVGVVAIGILWVVNVPSIVQAQKLVYGLSIGQSKPFEGYALLTEANTSGGLASQEVSEQLVNFAVSIKTRTDIPLEKRVEIFTYALNRMEKEVERVPTDARLRIEYAAGLRAGHDYPNALVHSAAALALSPKKQTLMMERGFEFWEAGQAEEARDIFVQMYELDPSFTGPAVYAAAGEIALGNVKEGDLILMQAFGTNIVDDEALIIAYYQAKRYDRLVMVLELHLQKDQSTQSHIRLASAYVLAGQYQKARESAQAALRLHPEDTKAISSFITKLPR